MKSFAGGTYPSTLIKGSKFFLGALVAFLAALTFATAARGQGTVDFYNRRLGIIVTHVYAPNSGNPVFGQVGNGSTDTPAGVTNWSGWAAIGQFGAAGQYGGSTTWAQLLSANGADQLQANLVPGTPVTTFRTGVTAGAVAPTIGTLGGVPVDAAVATVQLVAWDNTSGLYSTWVAASNAWYNGLIAAGKSMPINVYAIGGGTNTLPMLIGLESFSLYFGGSAHMPWILKQPQSQTVSVAQSAVMRFFISGTDVVAYQWKLNGTNILNATNEVYIIPSASFADAGSYTVVAGTDHYPQWCLSTPAVLTVQGMPAIVTPPLGSTLLVGQTANFNPTVAGTPTLYYQWQLNSTNLPGATSLSLTLTNVQLSQAGDYRIVVTNSYGSATSSPAHLYVADSVLLNSYTAVELEFTPQTNIAYYIQASPDHVVWTNYDGPIYGNGHPWSKTYSTRGSAGLFYRVWWVP